MRIIKKFTVADFYNTGIPVANIKTNCPTFIRILYSPTVAFDISGFQADIKLDSASPDINRTFYISNASSLNAVKTVQNDVDGFLLDSDTIITMDLISGGSPTPTTGEFYIIVEVQPFGLS